MEQRLAIDSVMVDALDIRFTEVSDQTGEAGTVTFDGTTAVIHHFTNDSAELAHDRYMRLHARARALGAGDLTVDFRFRSEDHTSELQSLMRLSYAVFCLIKKKKQ